MNVAQIPLKVPTSLNLPAATTARKVGGAAASSMEIGEVNLDSCMQIKKGNYYTRPTLTHKPSTQALTTCVSPLS